MKTPTKIRIRQQDKQSKVMVLISHPMESGQRKDKNGKRVPAHYVNEVQFSLNGKPAARVVLGPQVAKNPLIAIILNDTKHGDTVSVQWVDNQSLRGDAQALVA